MANYGIQETYFGFDERRSTWTSETRITEWEFSSKTAAQAPSQLLLNQDELVSRDKAYDPSEDGDYDSYMERRSIYSVVEMRLYDNAKEAFEAYQKRGF